MAEQEHHEHQAHEHHEHDHPNELPLNDEHRYPEPAPKHEHVAPDYHKKQKDRPIFTYVIVAVLAIGLIVAAYWTVFKPKSASDNNQSAQTKSPTKIESDTKHYDSPNFYLGFDYPSNWTVNDNGGPQMTVVSPVVKLKDAQSQTVNGKIIMTIRNKSEKLTEFDKGNAIAILNSEKITYTKPTQTQRGDTYISFLNYASSPSDGLDGVYITGDNGYQKDQAIPLVDISKSDPVISVTFQKCTEGKCTPLTVGEKSWSDPSFSKPIKSLLESLSIT